MKILIDTNFTDDQVSVIQEMATRYGDHQVLHAASEEEAVAMASDIEVLIGFIRPSVFAAAPGLRWAQSLSAGMNNVLFAELIESDVVVSNVAGLYAPQGGEHAWTLLLALGSRYSSGGAPSG